jgi:hypothetical protein
MKTGGCFFIIALLSVLLAACVSTNPYVRVDDAVYRGRFHEGSETLENQRWYLYRDRDQVLYYLDKGMINHYAGDYEDSTKLLQDGERAIEAAFTKSITMEISTYILNDTAQEYGGEDYEDIYINVFNALNYYHQDNLEDALVEIRRMNNKLRYLAVKYGVLISNLQKKALEEHTEIPQNELVGDTKFNDSALARYLGLLFYRGTGRYDDARIDRNFLKIAMANAPGVYGYPVPASVDDELDIPRGLARLNVIGFGGLGPIKTESVIRIPLPRNRWIKIALPVMTPRPSRIARIEAVVDSGEHFDLELLEDIDGVARETFKKKAALIYIKTVIRASLKGTTSSVLSVASDEIGGGAGDMLRLLSWGAQAVAEVTEQADLRLARYFPSKAYVGGVNLSPGVHTVTVNFYARNGRLLDSFTKENFSVRENTLNLMEAVCLD